MKNSYKLYEVGGFWEVFNSTTKTTVYVNPSKAKCSKVMNDLQQGKTSEALLK